MTYFIGDVSALNFLLTNGKVGDRIFGVRRSALPKATRMAPHPGMRPLAEPLKGLGAPFGIPDGPAHVNVATLADRNPTKDLCCHVWNGPERGTYLKIDDDFCVMTPEACFMQMASHLELPHLIELGCLLCGTYVPESVELAQYHSNLEPQTTPQLLAHYVARCNGMKGFRRATQALRYVAAYSASPMETKLLVACVLPPRLGGYGFEKPLLNKEIEASAALLGQSWGSVRKPDLLWPKKRFALEYNGAVHTDAAADAKRYNELAGLGLKLVIARKENVNTHRAFEALMTQVADNVGPRRESKAALLPKKRYGLWQQLFGLLKWEIGSD